MKEYKYVSLPSVIVVKKITDNAIIENYFDVIKEESVDGWEFVGVAPVTILAKKGVGDKENAFNTFIFAREKD